MGDRYKYELPISYSACCKVDNLTYFSCNTFNGLFSYDNDIKNIAFVSWFSDEPFLATFIHQKAIRFRNKIVFIPFNSGKISIYDIYTKEIKSILINSSPYAFCIDAVQYEEYVWLFFAHENHSVVKFCLDNYSVEYLISNKDIINNISNYTPWRIFYTPFSISNTKIYGGVWGTNSVFCLDLKTGAWNTRQINIKNIKLSSVVKSEEYYYCTAVKSNYIYKYNISTNQYDILRVSENIEANMDTVYPLITYWKDMLIVVPHSGDCIYSLRDKESVFEVFCKIPEGYDIVSEKDIRISYRRMFQYEIINNQIIVFPFSSTMRLSIDCNNQTCSYVRVCFNKEYVEDIYDKCLQNYLNKMKGNIIDESKQFGFDSFIHYLNKQID